MFNLKGEKKGGARYALTGLSEMIEYVYKLVAYLFRFGYGIHSLNNVSCSFANEDRRKLKIFNVFELRRPCLFHVLPAFTFS